MLTEAPEDVARAAGFTQRTYDLRERRERV